MSARPDRHPGQYKTQKNRAGSTEFVAPDLVRGTLGQGFKGLLSLATPFQRAVFMMFLVAEVHPFSDGNGRLSRIMMNAELVSAGEQRIIVPTIYRTNYLAALKAISTEQAPRLSFGPWILRCDLRAQSTGGTSCKPKRNCARRKHSWIAPRRTNKACDCVFRCRDLRVPCAIGAPPIASTRNIRRACWRNTRLDANRTT